MNNKACFVQLSTLLELFYGKPSRSGDEATWKIPVGLNSSGKVMCRLLLVHVICYTDPSGLLLALSWNPDNRLLQWAYQQTSKIDSMRNTVYLILNVAQELAIENLETSVNFRFGATYLTFKKDTDISKVTDSVIAYLQHPSILQTK